MKWIFQILLLGGIGGPGWPNFAYGQEAPSLKSGLQLYMAGDFDGCSKTFLKLVKTQPPRTVYWFNLGNCFFMAGRYSLANKAYTRAVTLGGELLPAVQLYQAKALAKLGQTAQAEALLREVIQSNPPAGILAEARNDLQQLGPLGNGEAGAEVVALQLYKNGQYREAELLLRKMGAGKLSGDSKLLLAFSLLRQEKKNAATLVFKMALRDPELHPEGRRTVLEILRQLREDEKKQASASLYADLSYGTTNNVFLEGRSIRPISSQLLRIGLGGSYGFEWNPTWSQRIGYSFDYEAPQSAPELRTQSHMLQIPVILESSPLQISLIPYVQEQIWNQSSVSRKWAGLLQNTYRNSKFEAGLDLEYFSQQALSSQYSYLGSSSYSARVYYSFRSGGFSAQIYWLLGQDGLQDITYGDGAVLPLRNQYQGPGARVNWQLARTWLLHFNMFMLNRNYSTAALPGEKLRRDQEIGASAKFSYLTSSQWKAYVLAEYNPNSSTLGAGDVRDKNYTNSSILVGLAWEAF